MENESIKPHDESVAPHVLELREHAPERKPGDNTTVKMDDFEDLFAPDGERQGAVVEREDVFQKPLEHVGALKPEEAARRRQQRVSRFFHS